LNAFQTYLYFSSVPNGVTCPWVNIIRSFSQLRTRILDLFDICSIKVGSGDRTKFWHDLWFGATVFKSRFHRIFVLDLDRDCLVMNRASIVDRVHAFCRLSRGGAEEEQFLEMECVLHGLTLSGSKDNLSWSLESSGVFSVASMLDLSLFSILLPAGIIMFILS